MVVRRNRRCNALRQQLPGSFRLVHILEVDASDQHSGLIQSVDVFHTLLRCVYIQSINAPVIAIGHDDCDDLEPVVPSIRIQVSEFMLQEVFFVHEHVEITKHLVLRHVVAVDNVVEVGEISGISCVQVQGPGCCIFFHRVVGQVIVVVSVRGEQQWVVDVRVVNGQPTDDVGVLFLEFFKRLYFLRKVRLVLNPLLRVSLLVHAGEVQLHVNGDEQQDEHKDDEQEVEPCMRRPHNQRPVIGVITASHSHRCPLVTFHFFILLAIHESPSL